MDIETTANNKHENWVCTKTLDEHKNLSRPTYGSVNNAHERIKQSETVVLSRNNEKTTFIAWGSN